MAVVRTITGDVSPDTLGVVNAHDHLIRVGAGEVYIDPDHLLDDVDKAAQEATYFVEASRSWADGATIVDMCPASSGRGVLKTLEVVEKVPGLQVVQATGFFTSRRSTWNGVRAGSTSTPSTRLPICSSPTSSRASTASTTWAPSSNVPGPEPAS